MRTFLHANRYLVGAAIVVIAFLLALLRGPNRQPVIASFNLSIEGREDDPNGRLEFELMRLRDPASGTIPANIREKELAFASGIPRRPEGLFKTGAGASTLGTTWNKRGPYNVGGRTRALALDKTNSSIIVAGGVSGGMWRSSNSGGSWTETTTSGQLHSVTCLVQDTRTSQTSTWYYGTGEYYGSGNGGGGAFYQGDGIYKSTDGGASWAVLSSTALGHPQLWDNPYDYVWDLAIDPSNSTQSVVYAAIPGFIMKSTDGGTSWSPAINASSPAYSYVTDVQVTSTGVVYATVSNGSSSAGIWRSPDGVTWTNIKPTDMPSTINRIVIGIAPSNESIVYFLAETPGAGYQTTYAGRAEAHSFWQYTYLSGNGSGAGGSWSNRSSNLPNFGMPVGNFASQGSYDLVIKVKPDNSSMVFIGGTDLFRSPDGFATASAVWIGGYATVNNVSQYASHHADQHALVFNPSNTSQLYSGHDGGISVTTNCLASTVTWSTLDVGYTTTQFYSVALDHATSGDPVVIGGMQDNGSWYTSSSSGLSPWISEFSGDGTFCAIADGKTSYYFSYENGVTYRMVLASNGGLNDFARVDPTGATGYLFVSPFVLDPNNTDMMYLAAGTTLWRNSDLTTVPTFLTSPSTANSTTSVGWTNLSSSNVGTITALGASTTGPAYRLYYGTSAGNVYRLDNMNSVANTSGQVDVSTGKGLPAGAYVSCIAVDPTNGNNALLIFSNYSILSVFYTGDGGSSWTNVGGTLEQNASTGAGNGPSVRWASIVPVGGSTVYYAATSTGLYSTSVLNGTSTVWAQEGASTIGNVITEMIATRISDGMVVVGTHGQGVFSGTATVNAVVEAPTRPVTTALLQNYPNPFNPSTVIHFSLATVSHVTLNVFDMAGREVATLVNGDRVAGSYDIQFTPEHLASGMYVYRLQARPIGGGLAGAFQESKRLIYLR